MTVEEPEGDSPTTVRVLTKSSSEEEEKGEKKSESPIKDLKLTLSPMKSGEKEGSKERAKKKKKKFFMDNLLKKP